MSDAEIEAKVLALFLDIAPDVDPSKLQRDVDFRRQFDFDSMDTLSFATSLSKTFGIDVPETAYPELASLAKAAAFVTKQSAKK